MPRCAAPHRPHRNGDGPTPGTGTASTQPAPHPRRSRRPPARSPVPQASPRSVQPQKRRRRCVLVCRGRMLVPPSMASAHRPRRRVSGSCQRIVEDLGQNLVVPRTIGIHPTHRLEQRGRTPRHPSRVGGRFHQATSNQMLQLESNRVRMDADHPGELLQAQRLLYRPQRIQHLTATTTAVPVGRRMSARHRTHPSRESAGAGPRAARRTCPEPPRGRRSSPRSSSLKPHDVTVSQDSKEASAHLPEVGPSRRRGRVWAWRQRHRGLRSSLQ